MKSNIMPKNKKNPRSNSDAVDGLKPRYSPKKLKASVRPNPKTKVKTYLSTIYTERVGKFGEIMVCHVKKQNGNLGFMYPCVHAIRGSMENVGDQDHIGFKLTNENDLDCRLGPTRDDLLYLRKSREDNSKIIAANGYAAIAIVSFPNNDSLYGLQEPIAYEKHFRDMVEMVLVSYDKRNNKEGNFKTKFAEWNPIEHSLTRPVPRLLDEVLIDDSVGEVLTRYVIGENDNGNAYDAIKDENSYFSMVDGSYSDYSIENFGFPKSDEIAELHNV